MQHPVMPYGGNPYAPQAPGYGPGYGQQQYGPPPVQYVQAPPTHYQPQVPAGYSTVPQPLVPPNMTQRVGPSEIIHQELFDHPLAGIGEVLIDNEPIFSNPSRIGLPQFTNLKKAGELSNNKQFEIAGIYCHFKSDQPPGTTPPAGAPSAPRLFYLLNTYSRVTLKIQNAEKMDIQVHRLGAGGGVWGFDNNTSAFVKNFGQPESSNVFVLGEGFVVPPLKTFSLQLQWMSNLSGAFNPLLQFNANTTAEKMLRFGLIGWEVRDIING